MVRGILGIILCPMLDDNLVYSMGKDPEEKNVIVVQNAHNRSIRRKLDSIGQKYDLVNWNDILGRIYEIDRDRFTILIYSLDLGLHSKPEVLKNDVEEVTSEMQPFVDAIGFYLGTCGNFNWDPPKWCEGKGYKPSATFHDEKGNLCHDCVGINIAGGPKYTEMQQKYTGHFYLFPAMANNFDDFMEADQAEAAATEASLTPEMREVLGIEPGRDGYMRWLFTLGGYEYILKIDTGIGDRENFDKDVEKVAERVRLKIKDADDYWPSLQPSDDLYRECKEFLSE